MGKTKAADLTEDRLFSLGWGLVYQPVCAPKSWDAERVSSAATVADPPGTFANRWTVAGLDADCPREDFPTNPAQCSDCTNRRHWLLNC